MALSGIHRLRLNRKGSASLEFALVAPLFFLMLFAIFDISYTVFVQTVLDGSARDAARLIRTGQVQTSGNPVATFQTQLCNEVNLVTNCGAIVYDVESFGSWSTAASTLSQPITRDQHGNFANPQFSPGSGGSIVAVRVTYNRPFLTSIIRPFVGQSAFLMSTVIFQNEPKP